MAQGMDTFERLLHAKVPLTTDDESLQSVKHYTDHYHNHGQ